MLDTLSRVVSELLAYTIIQLLLSNISGHLERPDSPSLRDSRNYEKQYSNRP
jgi:hypothetical protein